MYIINVRTRGVTKRLLLNDTIMNLTSLTETISYLFYFSIIPNLKKYYIIYVQPTLCK